ncbi:hypothetical protein Efla_007355 [Eimeria flavescens]
MGKSELPFSSLASFPSLGKASDAPCCPPVLAGAWGLRAAAAKLAAVRKEATESVQATAAAPSDRQKEEEEEEEEEVRPAADLHVAFTADSRAGESMHRAASPRSPKTISTCAEGPSQEAHEAETDEEKAQSAADYGDETSSGGPPAGAEAADELVGRWVSKASPVWGKAEAPESREASLRHFLAPLSREQLLDLLSWAALRDRQVYQHCADRVHASPSSRRLMVRNVHFNTSDERFTSFFETFGCVDDALIVRERDGHSRGYGFVTFTFPEGVNRCFVACPLTLDGRQLHIKLAADLFTSREQTKLFVRNLHEQTTAETLRDIFSPFGTLEECVVVRDSEGRSKGYGFLNFSTPMEAFKAVQMSERIIDGRMVFIHFASSAKGALRGPHHPARSAGPHTRAPFSATRRLAAAAADHSSRGFSLRSGQLSSNWEFRGFQNEGRQRHRRAAAAEHQRSSYVGAPRLPMSRLGGGALSGDPLLYADSGFGDLYGLSLSPFPFLTASQAADVKNPLSAAYAQFYPYPVGPPYYPLGPESQGPFGGQSSST